MKTRHFFRARAEVVDDEVVLWGFRRESKLWRLLREESYFWSAALVGDELRIVIKREGGSEAQPSSVASPLANRLPVDGADRS
jgi:hypothetical protein